MGDGDDFLSGSTAAAGGEQGNKGGTGTIANLSFVGLTIGGVRVHASNFNNHFALGAAADPHSKYGGDGNVNGVSFADI